MADGAERAREQLCRAGFEPCPLRPATAVLQISLRSTRTLDHFIGLTLDAQFTTPPTRSLGLKLEVLTSDSLIVSFTLPFLPFRAPS